MLGTIWRESSDFADALCTEEGCARALSAIAVVRRLSKRRATCERACTMMQRARSRLLSGFVPVC
eukprot:4526151-Pyramimonas_sp.AAC.2